jgi:hypothetical protein
MALPSSKLLCLMRSHNRQLFKLILKMFEPTGRSETSHIYNAISICNEIRLVTNLFYDLIIKATKPIAARVSAKSTWSYR